MFLSAKSSSQLCFTLCALSIFYHTTLGTPPGPIIDLGYVSLVGNATSPAGSLNGPVQFFGGIPYAQPPLGHLRFRAPQPLNETPSTKSNAVVRDARNWGPACIQFPAVVGVGSEDCLLLNVWKPSGSRAGDNLPVIVYIHGGGLFRGMAQGFPLYDWVDQSQAIVAVSLGYRLNMFGFLSSPSMAPTDLNAGLLDQRAALEWVQRHVSKFGGDPRTVTIAGESAGGESTVMQIVAYGGTRPLPFTRAISQSIGYGPAPTEAESAEVLRNATTAAGCPEAGEEALDCLRDASVGALISALNHVSTRQLGAVVSGPGTLLPDFPSALIRSGSFTPVDYIGGHCTNDGRTFTAGTPTSLLTEQQLIADVLTSYPKIDNSTLGKVLELYPAPNVPGSPFATEYDRTSVIIQDSVFSCMDWFLANRTAELGGNRTFTYRFNAPDPVLWAANPYLGVMHTSDLYFLFDGTNTAPNAGFTFAEFNSTETPLSHEMISYWTSFIRTGSPSTHKQSFSPVWEGQETGRRVVMTRSDTPGTGTASTLEEMTTYEVERCRFWMGEDVTRQTRL